MGYIKIILLILLVACCAYTDYKVNKIKNKVLIVFILLGIIFSFIDFGAKGIISSFLGIVLPFIGLYFFYIIKALGAGDIKLFCTIGSIMGYEFVINNIVYSLIVGGIIASVLLIKSKKLFSSLKNIAIYFINFFQHKKIMKYVNKDGNKKIPFGVIIFIGTIAQLIVRYNFF